MSTGTQPATGKKSGVNSQSTLDARAKARAVTSDKESKLSAADKWAINQIRAARAALKQAQEAILNGKPATENLISNCADTVRFCGAVLFAED